MGLTAVSGMTIAMEKVPALACPTCHRPLRLQAEADALRVLTDGWVGGCCAVGIRVEALSPAGTIRAQRQYWVEVEVEVAPS